MEIKAHLSIGYAVAMQKETIEIDDEEMEGMTEEERNEYISDYVQEWANNYIEVWWEED